tara:strand:+ start:346 stop:597 length:252 start_codon:yes stop_codon:yes gene_type:complete
LLWKVLLSYAGSTLNINVEKWVIPLMDKAHDILLSAAIYVVIDDGMFHELALTNLLFKSLSVQKMVIIPITFTCTRWACGAGD